MTKKRVNDNRKGKNVGSNYRQSVLSGFGHILQSGNRGSDSTPDEQRREETSPLFPKQQKAYQVFIPVILEPIGNGDGEYTIKVSLPANIDVLASTYAKRSKRQPKPDFAIPNTHHKKTTSVLLDYGIYKDGAYSLSHTAGRSPYIQIAEVFSYILGAIDATLECALFSDKDEAGNDDKGECVESTSAPGSVAGTKTQRRSKKIHSEIRIETIPESTAKLDEDNRTVLGDRQGNGSDRLQQMGDNTHNRRDIKDDAVSEGTSDKEMGHTAEVPF